MAKDRLFGEDRMVLVSSPRDPSPRALQQIYKLKFFEEADHPAKDIEFEADDAYDALIIAHSEARRRSAELWSDGKMLCSITRKDDEVRMIGPTDGGAAR